MFSLNLEKITLISVFLFSSISSSLLCQSGVLKGNYGLGTQLVKYALSPHTGGINRWDSCLLGRMGC